VAEALAVQVATLLEAEDRRTLQRTLAQVAASGSCEVAREMREGQQPRFSVRISETASGKVIEPLQKEKIDSDS
jgi:hypothetical protein